MNMTGRAGEYFAHAWRGKKRIDVAFTLIVLAMTLRLVCLPTGYEKKASSSERAKALVLETDDAMVRNFGIVMQGEQLVKVRILGGAFKGLEADANNILYGKADLDKLFAPGDVALAVIDPAAAKGAPPVITLMDHYRLGLEGAMVIAFFVLLLLYGGWTGARSAAAFLFAVAAIWKVLIPAFLSGVPPVLASLGTVAVLSGVIILLVAGFTRTGAAAILGSLAGTAVSGAAALMLAEPSPVNGAVRPFAETLLYGGFDHLNLTQIFLTGTFLASSGAFIDLAMDIAASMEEVHAKRPELGFKELVFSGLTVGRKIIGTETTTLLLAYTGGYTSLLMVFMAQGVPMANMFNITYVSSEVFHTMIGSLGLLTIAPFTALAAGALFSARRALAPGAKLS